MRIKSLAQGENILMLRIEPSTFVSKVDILTTTPIVHWKDCMERIMSEENGWDHNVDVDAERPLDYVSRDEMVHVLKEIIGKERGTIGAMLSTRRLKKEYHAKRK